MKTFIISILIITSSIIATAQNTDPQNMKVETKKAYYPGGDSLFFATLSKNIQFTDEAKAKQIRAEVMVSFDVMPDGSLVEISILNNPGAGVGEAIKNALSKMKFTPSTTSSGMALRSSVMISIPIRAY